MYLKQDLNSQLSFIDSRFKLYRDMFMFLVQFQKVGQNWTTGNLLCHGNRDENAKTNFCTKNLGFCKDYCMTLAYIKFHNYRDILKLLVKFQKLGQSTNV